MAIQPTAEFEIRQAVLDMFYPVGTTYITKDMNFNPNTSWGGTWIRVEGVTIVGYSTTDTDFNSTTKSGGSKTANITHSHVLNGKGAGARLFSDETSLFGNIKTDLESYTAQYKYGASTPAWENATSSTGVALAGSSGNYNGTINIQQPYVVRCVWERTA